MSVVLRATHTHLYPGARVEVGPGEAAAPGSPRRAQPCVVEFADGGAATAMLECLEGQGLGLRVDGYTTRAGTVVAPRRWQLEALTAPARDAGRDDAARQRFRVRRRLALDARSERPMPDGRGGG